MIHFLTRLAAVSLVALAVAGCAKDFSPTVGGGECKAFERPEYAVQGKKPYDQNWIDRQIESGVAACKWHRPAARPAALDDRRDLKPIVKKRVGFIARLKQRVAPAPTAPAPTITPAPISTPREPLDELLDAKR